MPPPNSNINTDTKNHMLKSIFVLTNVLLHIKQTGLHKKNPPCHIIKIFFGRKVIQISKHVPSRHRLSVFNTLICVSVNIST